MAIATRTSVPMPRSRKCVGQLVGASIKLAVAQALFGDRPAPVRRACAAPDRQTAGESTDRVRRERRRVPVGCQRGWRRSRRATADRRWRIAARRQIASQQVGQCARTIRATVGGVEQVGGVDRDSNRYDAVAVLEGAERQVELARPVPTAGPRNSGRRAVRRHVWTRSAGGCSITWNSGLYAEAARRLQRFHQLFERQVLMGLGAEQRCL